MHSHLHIHMAHAPCPASGAGRYIKHARATRVCGVPSVETIAAALALPPLGAPGAWGPHRDHSCRRTRAVAVNREPDIGTGTIQ